MKKLFVIVLSTVLAAASLSAQDLAQATEAYNTAATALAGGDKAAALSAFESALSLAEALGGEGAEIAQRCKSTIPNLLTSIAKDCIKGGDAEGAIAKIGEAVAKAEAFGDADAKAKAEELYGTAWLTKGNSLLEAKSFAEAADAFKKALDYNPANGAAAIRLGQALDKAGDLDGAIEAYGLAKDNGQAKNADKLLGTAYAKKAAAALKAQDYKGAFELAEKCLEFGANANAYKIAGNAATQLKNYSAAISYFEKYLAAAPTAKDAAAVTATIEALKKQQ